MSPTPKFRTLIATALDAGAVTVETKVIDTRFTTGEQADNKDTFTHYIACGDTLGILAKKYGTTVEELVRLNNLKSKDYIRAGEKLQIPASCQPLPEDLLPYQKRKLSKEGNYTVQKGDSLWNIAEKFNTTVGELARLNNIDNTNLGNIYAEEKLWVPIQYASRRPISKNNPDGSGGFFRKVDDLGNVYQLDLVIAIDENIINSYGIAKLKEELNKQYSQLIGNSIEGVTGDISLISTDKAAWNTPIHMGQLQSGGSVGGATWGLNCNIMPLYNSENNLRPLTEVVNVILHESLHVYLGAHPFEQAYGTDDQLYYTGGVTFESIPNVTNSKIKENIMMYSYMVIDNIKISDYLKENNLLPLYLTQGQVERIFFEMNKMQEMGSENYTYDRFMRDLNDSENGVGKPVIKR